MLIFRQTKEIIKCLLVLCLALSTLGFAKSHTTAQWQQFIAQLKKEATLQGIESLFFDRQFADMLPDSKVLQLDRQQAPKPSSTKARPTDYHFILTQSPAQVQEGIKQYVTHKNLILAIAKEYSLDPAVILAIWGKESYYGQYTGRYPILRSLATLAFDSRRGKFFRTELLQALHILQEQHVTEQDFKGSWAGASGLPQFMPTSWQHYAIDYNKDGKRDIWTNTGDALASIANYLDKNGWQAGQRWWLPVTLTKPIKASDFGLKVQKKLTDWQALGVDIKAPLSVNSMASLLKDKDHNTYLVLPNFRVLMRYNLSLAYASSVAYLADRIAAEINQAQLN